MRNYYLIIQVEKLVEFNLIINKIGRNDGRWDF